MTYFTGRRLAAGLAGLSAAAALTLGGAGFAQADEGQILNAGAPDTIKGSYLVALTGPTAKDAGTLASVTAEAEQLADRYNGTVGRVFSAALRGFSVQLNETQAKRLAADPSVRYVEQNQVARISETWGLDRIDQRDLPLDNSYTAPNDGSGATAYVVDTGMDLDHPEYGGRASSGYDFIDNDADASDCQGHGTHVGGTVGANTWGVAKKVKLVAVRVLNCQGSGSYDAIISGIDWVTKNAPQAAVGNMSLGGGKSQAVNDAVTRSTDAGVAWAVAAGNEGQDACNVSPASAASALTTAASDKQDKRSIFNTSQSSNYGSCVDLFAPGSGITSSTNGGGSGLSSGTSMASPHVAGALALYFTANPAGSVANANAKVLDTSTPGKITDLKGSPNKLLYVNELGGATQPGNPVPSFTANCSTTEPSCSFDGSGSTDPDGSISSYAWDFGDGRSGTGVSPSHTYGKAGAYTVKLTVTDDSGKSASATKQVQAGAPPAGGAPRASFTVQCQWAVCNFNATGSTDPDNDIASYAWSFGDGKTGSGVTASNTYPNVQKTYTAQLKVTDRSGNSNSTSRQVQCWSVGAQGFCFAQ